MPVQINEVIIKTVVDPAPGAANGQNRPAPSQDAGNTDLLEKLLEILRDKKER